MVSKEYVERRHVSSESNYRAGIVASDAGLVSTEMVPAYKSKVTVNSAFSSHPQLIGGIPDQQQWRSENQRLFEREPTNKDQYAFTKRVLPAKRCSETRQENQQFQEGTFSPISKPRENLKIGNRRSFLANIGAALLDQMEP